MAEQEHKQSNEFVSMAVIALSLAAFASGMSQRVTDPLLPRLASEFSLPVGTVSWVITCFTIGYSLCQLFFGPIGDRYGKYLVIAWACVASSVASLLCALAPTLPFLLAARVLAGGMIAAIIPLAMAWIGDVVPYERRQWVLARFLIGQIMGVSAGQLLGGLSADYFGWRVPFFFIATVLTFDALLLFAVRKRLPVSALTTGRSEGHVLQHMWREIAAILMQPWARVVLLTVLLEGAFVFGGFAFFASHLHGVLGVSLTVAGAIVMLFGLGGILFAAASRRLVPSLGEIGLARWGACIMLVSLSTVALGTTKTIVALGCAAMGLGFYMLHNTLQTNATQMAPERRGAAVSAFAFCYFMGQSLGVAAAGLLVGHVGTAGVILAAGPCVLLVALYFSRAKARWSKNLF